LQCGFDARIIGEVDLRGDPAVDAVLLGRVHDAVLAGDRCPVGPRTLISDSWRRSLTAHVDPDHDEPPVVYDHDTVEGLRTAHPLGEVGALLSTSGRVIATESCGGLPPRVDITAPDGLVRLPDGREATVEPLAAGFLLRVAGRQRTRTPKLSLAFLGATHPVAVLDGRTLPLSLRHAEILTLLSLHRPGMSAEALAIALHGEAGNPVTARAEMHRLRAQLGDRVMRTRPYRLAGDVDADFLAVPRLLHAGRLAEALAAWRGPLLPCSDAPGVREERDDLIVALRDAVLHRRDAGALWSFAQTETGADDLAVLETLATLLPPTDTRRSVVLARIRCVFA
jgi:hypothetical protein